MFNKQTLVAALAIVLSAPLITRAEVSPLEPGPGDVFRVGQTCHTTWGADPDSKTAWKDMVIQLMTGSNDAMVDLTIVASGQDGTVAGKAEFPCPAVYPYSAIYFYQFSSPHTEGKEWNTRFTIASASGDSSPPTNAKQPGTNEDIPWGTGTLGGADPSTGQVAQAAVANGTTGNQATIETILSAIGSLSSVLPLPSGNVSLLHSLNSTSATSSSSTSALSSSTGIPPRVTAIGTGAPNNATPGGAQATAAPGNSEKAKGGAEVPLANAGSFLKGLVLTALTALVL